MTCIFYSEGTSPKLDCSEFEAELEQKRSKNEALAAKLGDKPDSFLDNELPDFLSGLESIFEVSTNSDILNAADASKVFDPLDVAKSVSYVTNNPELIVTLSDCQFDYVLRWKEAIERLDKDTMFRILMSEKVAARIEAIIPHSTYAILIQSRRDFFDLINGTFPGQEYLKTLLGQESFLKLLTTEYIANALEHKVIYYQLLTPKEIAKMLENTAVANIMTEEAFVVALEVYPDLPKTLGPKGLKVVQKQMERPSFYQPLSPEEIAHMLENPSVEDILTEEAFIVALKVHPYLPEYLGPNGMDFVQDLMYSRTFIGSLPIEDVARIIAYPNIQSLVSKESLFVALTEHPDLPNKLNMQALEFGAIFLTDQDFLTALPCAVYLNTACNSSFVNSLEPEVLQAFSTNEHFWACLPREKVEHMMRTTQIGSKLDVQDLLSAARTMSKAHKTNPALIMPIFDIQIPQVVSRMESDYYDWFNSMVDKSRKWFKKYSLFRRR